MTAFFPQRPLWAHLSSAAAFLLPALALVLPSGYSWGAVLLLIAALAGVKTWWRAPIAAPARALLAVIALMGLVWLLGSSGAGWGRLDRSSKYLLVLPCVLYLLVWPPQAAALRWGLALGAMGSGVVALYQTHVLGWPRASGFTNAIQYGDLSIFLALSCALWLSCAWASLGRLARAALLMGAVLGLWGSLLSHSRGGWLALLLGLPLWLWLLRGRWAALAAESRRRWAWPVMALALALSVVLIAATQGQALAQRIHLAYSEAQSYDSHGDADSSIGQRLAHWRFAWAMGWERPLLGWGDAAYVAEKNARIEAGDVPSAMRPYDHAHNEFLDMFAKRGLLGLAALLAFYALPALLFWPRRAQTYSPEQQALRLIALALPVSYVGFGLTQTFLAHNSGNLFYLFMLALLGGTIWGRKDC